MSAFAAVAAPVTTVVRPDSKTGKLVRRPVPGRTARPVADESLSRMVDQIASENGVEAPLVHSVIQAESNYSANAVSSKGAQGMMQLIPSTAKRFGVANSFDPKENIQGGVKYLKFLLDYFRGDYTKTIAAYNAGEAAVDKYKGIPPFAETRNYVSQVARNLQTARAARTSIPVVKLNPAVQTPETSRPILTSMGQDGRIYYRTP
ncbi:MAG TPA: lytic transglycosylase domain-containing protein [Bryobacteraceae bacterium]|jgi:soluble lytic murein transglycosylase-like protein|nr:lytic transglycosylase domain-containing protein [Bryobacteraceae bacterium]